MAPDAAWIAAMGAAMRWAKRIFQALGITGDIHFVLFTLGGASVLAIVVTTAVAFLTALPEWSLIGLGFGLLLMLIAAISASLGVIRGRIEARGAETSTVTDDPGRSAENLVEVLREELAIIRQERDGLRAKIAGHVESATVPDRVASAWLPDPTDLTTFSMTATDFDGALRRAIDWATTNLAPDAAVEFRHLSLTPSPTLVFGAESQLADRHTWVFVSEFGVYPSRIRRGSVAVTGADDGSGMVSVWALDSEHAPWREDDSLIALIRTAGYRLRPFDGEATVDRVQRAFDEVSQSWVWQWQICIESERGWGAKQCFWLQDGALVEPTWEHSGVGP